MAVCPNGHDSASDDFCDTCGMRIGGSPPPGSPQPGSPRHRLIARIGRSAASLARSRPPPLPRPNPARAAVPRGAASSARPAATTSPAPASPPPPRPPLRRPPRAPIAPASPAPAGSYSSGQPGPGSGMVPASSAASRAARPAVDVLVSVSAGHLDRGGGCGPRLLRAGAGGHRTGGFGRRFSLPTTPNAVSSSWATRCGSGGGAYRAAWPRRST